jgi:hypothetical protein
MRLWAVELETAGAAARVTRSPLGPPHAAVAATAADASNVRRP